MLVSHLWFGLCFLPLGSLLVRGISAGCVSSKKCGSESDEDAHHGGHGTDDTGASAGDSHGGTGEGYYGADYANDAQASTSWSQTAWAYPLEFKMKKSIYLPQSGKDDECFNRCWQAVEDYRSNRQDYAASGPAAHHHCSLGWIRFGWKSTIKDLPNMLAKEANNIVGGLRLHSHPNQEALKEQRKGFREQVAAIVRSFSSVYDTLAQSSEPTIQSECSTSAGGYHCHRIGGITMPEEEPFYRSLDRVNPKDRDPPDYTKPDVHLYLKMCKSEIGVLIEHFLDDQVRCKPKQFADQFQTDGWIRSTAPSGIDPYHLNAFSGAEMEDAAKMRYFDQIQVHYEKFDAFAAECMGRGFARPSELTQAPDQYDEVEMAFFQKYTNVIHWPSDATHGLMIQIASDATPEEYPPTRFM